MSLSISGLAKRYPGTESRTADALADVSFEVPRGAFVTLLGPSGCGKSTLLNLVAGLERPSAGSIAINGSKVCDAASGLFVPPGQRDISMVFQSYAIWPHMTVRENVAFPLKHGRKRPPSAAALDQAVDDALDKVRLGALAARPAPLLSGGQQQRVSLARALAQNPSLLLLDEPLSNLDAALREEMQKEIRSIVSGSGITTLYVTHDQTEALSMSDLVVVLREGRVEQLGTPREIYFRPATRFVAQFMGSPNLVEAEVAEAGAGDEFVVDCALGRLRVRRREGDQVRGDEKLTLVLKQEDLDVRDAGAEPAENSFAMKVQREIFYGDRLELVCTPISGAGPTLSVYAGARRSSGVEQLQLACRPDEIHYFRE